MPIAFQRGIGEEPLVVRRWRNEVECGKSFLILRIGFGRAELGWTYRNGCLHNVEWGWFLIRSDNSTLSVSQFFLLWHPDMYVLFITQQMKLRGFFSQLYTSNVGCWTLWWWSLLGICVGFYPSMDRLVSPSMGLLCIIKEPYLSLLIANFTSSCSVVTKTIASNAVPR